MDEPLSNLDAKLRVSMRAALNQLHERLGITTVYVTHDQVEAMTLGDRVCVHARRPASSRSTARSGCSTSPVNLFVAGLHRLPAMNFVGGLLDRGDGRATVSFAGLPAAGARQSVFEAKPGLDGYLGKQGHPRHPAVRLRGRPPSATPSWARFPVTVGVTEELGTEIHAIFTIDAPPVEHASIASASDGSSEEDETVTALAERQDAVDRARLLPLRRPLRAAARARHRHQPPALLRPRPAASRSATRSPSRDGRRQLTPAALVLSAWRRRLAALGCGQRSVLFARPGIAHRPRDRRVSGRGPVQLDGLERPSSSGAAGLIAKTAVLSGPQRRTSKHRGSMRGEGSGAARPEPGKVAVVTGGASGIGKGIATQLVAEGAQVVIADIQRDAMEATAEEIGAAGVPGRRKRPGQASTPWPAPCSGPVRSRARGLQQQLGDRAARARSPT